MGIVLEVLMGFFRKIGIAGVLVIVFVLSGWITYDYFVIKHKESKIVKLEEKVVFLNHEIEKQNAAIAQNGRQFKVLQNVLSQADDKNDETTKTFIVYKKILIDRPIATTCDAAMKEIKESSKNNAELWNKAN